MLQQNKTSEWESAQHTLSLHILLSISEQLRPAKGFNFRWEIEFCQDMICIRRCLELNAIYVYVYVYEYMSVMGFNIQTILSRFDRKEPIKR